MTEVPRYAVTGAAGAVGGRVARRLEALGLPQRLVVRDPAKAPEVAGAQVVPGSYADGESMRRALDGIDTLFLVSGRESRTRVEEHYSVVDAAAAAGVRRVVYTSFLAAAPDATFILARDHYATEARIRSTPMAYTFLRDSMYLDSVPMMVWADGVIRGPAGDGRVACVARDDVADVAVVALTQAGHEGATYDLTGPEARTLADMAAALSRHLGRTIRYENETLDEARASRAGFGAEAWEVEGWVTSYAAVATGEMDVVSDAVQRVSGHAPLSLEAYLDLPGSS
jgi:NAD(P)H dehydrogenase (quinone)